MDAIQSGKNFTEVKKVLDKFIEDSIRISFPMTVYEGCWKTIINDYKD